MVDDEVKIYEDILDIDERNLRNQICLVWMKKLRIRNGLNSLNLCGQKAMIVETQLMEKMLYVKRI
jgi:hypothetical protein